MLRQSSRWRVRLSSYRCCHSKKKLYVSCKIKRLILFFVYYYCVLGIWLKISINVIVRIYYNIYYEWLNTHIYVTRDYLSQKRYVEAWKPLMKPNAMMTDWYWRFDGLIVIVKWVYKKLVTNEVLASIPEFYLLFFFFYSKYPTIHLYI